jgi:hypothetical protein
MIVLREADPYFTAAFSKEKRRSETIRERAFL